MRLFRSEWKVFLFCLFLFFISAVSVHSESTEKKLELRIFGGLTYLEVGDWNAHHVGWNKHRRISVEAAGGTVLSENQELHWGKEAAGDLIYYLGSRFALSAGTGYIHGRVADSADTIVEGVEASIVHDFKVSAVPLRFGTAYFWPVFSRARILAGAGLSYYFTKFDRFYRRDPGTGY